MSAGILQLPVYSFPCGPFLRVTFPESHFPESYFPVLKNKIFFLFVGLVFNVFLGDVYLEKIVYRRINGHTVKRT
jgi:hypothetical protein